MRCPICRAENAAGPQCRRCRADLTLLFNLDEQRQHVLATAYRCVASGRLTEALALADGADALRGDLESCWLQVVVALAKRDFKRAWAEYPRLQQMALHADAPRDPSER
jgi:hypothetical protein